MSNFLNNPILYFISLVGLFAVLLAYWGATGELSRPLLFLIGISLSFHFATVLLNWSFRLADWLDKRERNRSL